LENGPERPSHRALRADHSDGPPAIKALFKKTTTDDTDDTDKKSKARHASEERPPFAGRDFLRWRFGLSLIG
jgi:hypothetical protein